MSQNLTVRKIAENDELWREYANPNMEDDIHMDTEARIKMMIELWPDDIDETDTEAISIRESMRQGK